MICENLNIFALLMIGLFTSVAILLFDHELVQDNREKRKLRIGGLYKGYPGAFFPQRASITEYVSVPWRIHANVTALTR